MHPRTQNFTTRYSDEDGPESKETLVSKEYTSEDEDDGEEDCLSREELKQQETKDSQIIEYDANLADEEEDKSFTSSEQY